MQPNIVVVVLLMSLLGWSASRADIDWIEIYNDPVMIPIPTDFNDYQAMIDSAANGNPQAIEQIKVNRARLSPPRSSVARDQVIEDFMADLPSDAAVFETIAREIAYDENQRSRYRQVMESKGLDPENIADASTGLTLSSLTLYLQGKAGLQWVSQQQVESVQRTVTAEIVTLLPRSVTAEDLQIGREELELEYLFQNAIADYISSLSDEKRDFMLRILLERAENKTGFDITGL